MQQPVTDSLPTPRDHILLTICDDTEESPWILMGTPQMDAVSSLYATPNDP